MTRLTAPVLATLLTIAVAFVLCVFCGYATAAPSLYSQAYPAGPGQPASASVTVDNVSQINCPLVAATDGSVTATCDLAALPGGTHTLVMTVTNTYGCTTGVDGNSATCTGGGTASSAPFSFVWNLSGASKPVLKVRP